MSDYNFYFADEKGRVFKKHCDSWVLTSIISKDIVVPVFVLQHEEEDKVTCWPSDMFRGFELMSGGNKLMDEYFDGDREDVPIDTTGYH